MKKIVSLLSMGLLICLLPDPVQAQSNWSDWSSWETMECFTGLQVCHRTKDNAAFKDKVKVQYKIKNNYYEQIHFDGRITDNPNDGDGKMFYRQHIKPKEEKLFDMNIPKNSANYYLLVRKVRFKTDDFKQAYHDCDE